MTPRRLSYGSREWNDWIKAGRPHRYLDPVTGEEKWGEPTSEVMAGQGEAPAAIGEFEWHVMGAKTIQGVQNELTSRSNDGWELVSSHFEDSGALGGGGNHVLIFRRRLAS